MGQPKADTGLRARGRINGQTITEARQALINIQIGNEWLDMESNIAWHGGGTLHQVVVKRSEDGWLLILKAHRNGRAYAAYVSTETLAGAFELGGELASKGALTWTADEWPSKWLKQKLRIK